MPAAPATFFPAALPGGLRIGLGGAPLGNLFGAMDDRQADAVVSAAWDSGCRSFDTAPHYGNGLSEHRIGHALRPQRDAWVSSKVGRLLSPDAGAPAAQHGYVDVLPFVQRFDYSRAGTRRSVEDSLQRLGRARLDAVYVHDLDGTTHGGRAPQVWRLVLDECLPELRRMQREGLVGAIGLGVNDVQVVLDVLRETELDVLMLAGRYSLLDQAALPRLLPECRRRGVPIALGGVFNSGILATGVRGGGPTRFDYAPASADWVARTAAIETLCEVHGVPLRAAALQFPLAHPAIDIVMVGVRTAAEWNDAVAMMGHAIPSAFWTALRAAGLLPAQAPTP
jgi:D-threo-aldose 1-dehydrogenase